MPREWVINDYNGFEGLELQACDIQDPGAGEVRLRIEAFALNWGDNDLMHDNYSFSFSAFPARIGMEAAGIVEAVGAEVEGIAIGDRYCTLPYFYDRQGASADTLIINQAYITKAPDGLTAVEAASIWMQFLTAYFPIVEMAKAAPGVNILVPAGTSTAGSAALQIGRMQGANMISTSRSGANRQTLVDNGADHVFIDDGSDIQAFLSDATDGVGVHCSFDPVGGDFMERYAAGMAKNGKLILYGALTGSYSHPPFLPMIQNSLWFHAYSLFNYVEDLDASKRGREFVYHALTEGALKPAVDRIFPMEGYVDAWRYLKGSRSTYGKVMVDVELDS